MKIALITASPHPIPAVKGGATETMMTHLLDVNEKEQKHEFGVFDYYDSFAEKESLKYKHSRFYFYRPNVFYDKVQSYFYRALRILTRHKEYLRSNFIHFCAKIINSETFDVVILEGNCFQAQHMRSLINNKLLLHMHIDRLNSELKESKDIMNSVDGLICISNYCKRRMEEVLPNKSEKILVLKNTVDVEQFNLEGKSEARDRIRREIGAEENQLIISYCGRLVEDKGVLELIRAIKSLKDKRLKLMIIGSSVYVGSKKTEYVHKLEHEAADLLGGVIFTGFISQKELPDYVKAADIAVVPSICQEAAGNVIIEALGCGTPVVASTQGGIPEYADETACELVKCDENFVSNIANAIKKLTTNKELYLTKSNNTRKIAIQYNKFNYYTNFTNIVNQLCK